MFDNLPLILAQDTPPPEVAAQEAPAAAPPPKLDHAASNGDLIESQGLSTTDPNGNATGTTDQPGQSFPWIFILLAMVLLWMVLMGGGRKEKKKRAAMLAAMGKGDKVQTIGGILGTVVEIKESEIIVKVDENANTRLSFAKSAIQSVIQPKDDNGH